MRGQVRLHHVSRRFRIVHERSLTLKETIVRRRRVAYSELWALRDVTLDIRSGEAVAFIGRNGAGKSTLLKVLAGILPPHAGSVEAGGSIAAMLELGSGFHPDFTGRENVFMNGALHGLRHRDVSARLQKIIDFAELADFIDMPVRTYSSGMQMRLAFAVAAHVNPDILLLDEVLTVGDAAFQAKCMDRIHHFLDHGGTLAFVSHDQNAVRTICSRAVLIDGGRVVVDGSPDEVLPIYEQLLEDREGGIGADVPDTVWSPPASVADPEYHHEEEGGEPPIRFTPDPGTLPVEPSATIKRMQITDPPDPDAQRRLPAGATVVVEVEVETNDPIAVLSMEITVTDSLRQTILETHSSDMAGALPQERGGFTCAIAFSLPIQEGWLNVNAIIRDLTTGARLDQWPESVPLFMERTWPGDGVLAVPVAWSVLPTADAHDNVSPGKTVWRWGRSA